MKIALTTLTPLWTGGTDPKEMRRIHESGVVGSLRWWYETIVRGLAGAGCAQDKVCDPTGPAAGRCNYEKHEWVCHACRLFGATGWARQFNLELNGGSHLFTAGNQITLRAPDGRNGWVFGNPMTSYTTPITGALHRVRGAHTINDLAVTMAIISRWGGLAAKTQHGFGVVQMQNEQGEVVPYKLGDFLRFGATATDDGDLPSLKNLFFAKLCFKDGVADKWWRDANLGTGDISGGGGWPMSDSWRVSAPFSVPIAPAIKYKLRFGGTPTPTSYLAAARGRYPEQFFFGDAGQNNRKAMLNVSHAYKDDGRWKFRIWGWLPEQDAHGLNRDINREQLMRQLHQLVTGDAAFWRAIFNADVIDFSRSEWRELNTGHTRNTPAPAINPDSCVNFLRELLS